jgi:16S rRNA (guanine(527)-N(7))-methyltransferase RsmG
VIGNEDIVPRETLPRIQVFLELLKRWNEKLNLVAAADTHDLWVRHVLDSAQIARLAPAMAATWVDLGSGAGFPGLICAAILCDRRPGLRFTLVEADARKAAFLREAARSMGLDVTVLDKRIEAISLPPQDVVSARALAPLPRLLNYAARFYHRETVLLFPKGRKADSELTLARRDWHIRAVRCPSHTDPDSTILRLTEVSPRR